MAHSLLRSALLTLTLVIISVHSSSAQQNSVARQWSETQLSCIRKYFAKPTVHARHLSHVSVAMFDAWAVYDDEAQPYFLGQTWGGFNCPFNGIPMPADGDLIAAQEKAISYAAYRTLWNRYTIFAPGANLLTIQGYLNDRMASLGYDTGITSIDYSDGDPAKLGNYIAAKLQEFALQDGSNQQNNYANLQYQPINGQLQPAFPGNPSVVDPNRWQALVLTQCIDQNNIPIECPAGTGTPALSHEWGNVTPFALTQDQADTLERDGLSWKVYLDPGAPPLLDTTLQTGLDESFYKWGYVMNIIWHSFHNNDDGVMVDASPNNIGGLNITSDAQLPQTFEDYQEFYNLFEGGVNDPGHTINPTTGVAYEPQMVPRKDFSRVLSQYWADGPNSETPPGHWFKLFNEVEDQMDVLNIEKRWMGEESVSDLEWDIKGYFALGGGIHDAAIACWGTKGYYDSTRPIMAIRWMGSKGQSTDPNLPHYHPAGLPLIPGYIELVGEGDSLVGANNEHLNKIKIYSWRGPFAGTGEDGAGWLLAENWWTYQTAGFVTPPFAGYYSGHSTYSRTGAEIMTLITGDDYFPGGMSEFVATQDEYLIADDGPSTTVKLQWATYRDAADQCSVSRIYGGLHPPQDDIPGRKVGLVVGPQAVDKANEFIHADPAHVAVAPASSIITDASSTWSVTITFDKAMDQNVTPTLIILNTSAASSLQLEGGSWTDAQHYVANYNVIDNNVTVSNIVISAQGAQDLNGVNNLPGVSAPFAIDTQNPMAATNIIGADDFINEAAVAQGSSFSVIAEFDEEMDTNTDPQFSFSAEGSSFVLNALSAWTSATEYRAVFDVVDNNAEALDIDIEVSSATDAVGNNQLIAMINDAISIDTDAPNGALTVSQNSISDASIGQFISVNIDYNSPMNTAIAPSINISGITLSNNLTLVGGSWNAEGTGYLVNYVILDGNTQASGVSFSATGAEDLAGNAQDEATSSNSLSFDTKNPMVNQVTASATMLADADAGLPFELSITFDEAMSDVDPDITFIADIPSLTHDAAASSWQGNTYVAVFNLTDANVEVTNIPVQISGAADAVGNTQNVIYYANNLFSVDTQNPEAVSIMPSTDIINSGGDASFAVTVNFTEAMDQSSAPDITFTPAVPLTLSATSGWDSDFTYTARYDVAAGEAAISDISVNVGTATQDAAGNPMVAAEFESTFSIDIANSIADLSGLASWTAYPNPVIAGQDVRLNIPVDITDARVMIFTSQGKLVADYNHAGNNNPMIVTTAGWSEGMYMVRLISQHAQGSLPVSVVR